MPAILGIDVRLDAAVAGRRRVVATLGGASRHPPSVIREGRTCEPRATGRPARGPDNVHNVVHLLTGLMALVIAFGLRGEQQANAVIGFGILYTIIFFAVGFMARGRASAMPA
jgi:hypothetical protein